MTTKKPNLSEKLQTVMRYATEIQDDLYDRLVLPNLGTEKYQEAYTNYMDELGGFDVRAFRKCVTSIRSAKEQDPQKFANWADKFKYIGEYVNARNNFNEKVKNINQGEGTPQEKAAMWDTLDRNRTRAHNGVISLFNDMNHFAKENNMTTPYPTPYDFDKNNPHDRARVADILMRHETLLETVNLLMTDEKTTESDTDRYKKMSFAEQIQEAREVYNSLVGNLTQNDFDFGQGLALGH